MNQLRPATGLVQHIPQGKVDQLQMGQPPQPLVIRQRGEQLVSDEVGRTPEGKMGVVCGVQHVWQLKFRSGSSPIYRVGVHAYVRWRTHDRAIRPSQAMV